MARDLQQIETELQDLENQAKTIAEQLEQAYQDYTDILGTTLKQQLIYSVYQLCTQQYPEAFLNLSLSQKQQLQQEVRELTKQAQDQLKLGGEILNQLNSSENNESEPNKATQQSEAESESELDSENKESQEVLFEQWESFSNSENHETSQLEYNKDDSDSENDRDALQQLLSSLNQESSNNTEPFHPDNIMAWLQLQEEAISTVLENISSQANEVLRKHSIFPQQFPKEMIDAALQAEGAGSISNRAPGVLHLMLEVERQNQQRKSEGKEVMQLAVIRLRVGELEFAAPQLNSQRRTIRDLEQKLQQLQKQYQNVSQERAIAQAEHAWHSSWYEDDS